MPAGHSGHRAADHELDARYLPQSDGAISVSWLLQNGYLVEERPA